ncbi:MAG: amino acid carrier protein [Firmicutes bacterium]|nr:amino acid carrier protein [Bacillota bacterium]
MKLLESILWAIVTGLILVVGILFSKQLHYPQFCFRKMGKALFQKSDKKSDVSMFSDFMMVLGGRIGVGSIAGVALAIWIGGPGSIFWMWVSTLFSAVLSYVETYLGMKYQRKDGQNYKGGPSYYIKYGLKNAKLGAVYAILIIACYICGFIGIQANTIQKSVISFIPVSKVVLACFIVFLVFLIIIKGVSNISKLSAKLVPIMTLFYIGMTLFVFILSPSKILSIFQMILTQAFQFDSIIGGLIPTMIVGIQRGIFSNEGGLGTGSIASSVISSVHKKEASYLQVLGVYITTLGICTMTAFFLLSTPYYQLNLTDVNGIEMIQYAFFYHYGNYGPLLLSISIFFFSFSTILTGYYYGESCLKYFSFGENKKVVFGLKIFTLFFIFVGMLMSSHFIWKLIDLFVAIIAFINIISMYLLRKEVDS